ncbi:DUF2231 domain-containing protein [Microvirga subterranea]|uniref:Putative membrane protein n=1 Tax=Microvirga subterranea TaxID=186651 RepID=A0A370HIZ3_9HYPH|nr:DUF2231 domain-containing protein [Microvirga subterranea]RDI58489.1 putative membrane protein [Microvirga subterranea]
MRHADPTVPTPASREFPVRDATSGGPLAAAWQTVASFPAVCFILALLNDIAYWRTANLQWQNFAEWLLFAGLVVGGVVLVVEVVGLLFRRRLRPQGFGWLHALGLLVVLGLGFVNSLVHARDGWTAVVPQGLALSVAMVIVMMITGWLGHASGRRRTEKVLSHG